MASEKNNTDLDSVKLMARKLRMVQLSFSDASKEDRSRYLAEALGGLIDGVLPDRRDECLQALEEHFPVWADTPATAPAAPVPLPAAPPPPETPSALADRLVAMAAMMDEDEREAIAQRLAQGRLTTSGSRDKLPERGRGTTGEAVLPRRIQEAMQYLMKQLEIEQIDFTRTAKLVLLFTSYMSQMDQIIWNTWRTVAPQTGLRRPGNLQKEICRYLSGDKDISGVEVKAHVETMQKLMASLVAAMGQLGSMLARQHLAKFAPMEIEIQAGSSLVESKETRCWRRYEKLARELEEDVIEHAVKDIIAQYTEAMMKRSG